MRIHKLDAQERELLCYTGEEIGRSPTGITVLARFDRTIPTAYTTFCKGDRVHEFFWSDRWFNIFATFDGESDRLKGWYCNITRPARIAAGDVYWSDLALDLWVPAAGEPLLLDEAEFEALKGGLRSAEITACHQAVATLRALAARRALPC